MELKLWWSFLKPCFSSGVLLRSWHLGENIDNIFLLFLNLPECRPCSYFWPVLLETFTKGQYLLESKAFNWPLNPLNMMVYVPFVVSGSLLYMNLAVHLSCLSWRIFTPVLFLCYHLLRKDEIVLYSVVQLGSSLHFLFLFFCRAWLVCVVNRVLLEQLACQDLQGCLWVLWLFSFHWQYPILWGCFLITHGHLFP